MNFKKKKKKKKKKKTKSNENFQKHGNKDASTKWRKA
jgi:hypothetical protein